MPIQTSSIPQKEKEPLMPSKPVGGFSLVLGPLYNDSWFNATLPTDSNTELCFKCDSPITIHHLEKFIFAFGLTIRKTCTVHTCSSCLNEEVITKTETKVKNKLKTYNLLYKFKSLSPELQKKIMEEVSILI